METEACAINAISENSARPAVYGYGPWAMGMGASLCFVVLRCGVVSEGWGKGMSLEDGGGCGSVRRTIDRTAAADWVWRKNGPQT